MNKQEIINRLKQNYTSFIDYVSSLSEKDYSFRLHDKWSATEQLEHILLCVRPVVKALEANTLGIQKQFGIAERPSLSYEKLLENYLVELNNGGKAPLRFCPVTEVQNQRKDVLKELSILIDELCLRLNDFSESELNSLLLPHPLLGNLTLREMLYNMMYHVQHHHNSIIKHLNTRSI